MVGVSFSFPKSTPRLLEILAHRRRQNPAGLRVGRRAHARQLVRLLGEARGEAGNLIAAARHHVGGRDAQARHHLVMLLAVLVEHAIPFVGLGQQGADIFEIGGVAVRDLVKVIGTRTSAVIAMDWTDFDADDQTTLSLVTGYRSRAIAPDRRP